ncbi:D-alanyl-D-alanine carboxypeptidase / D-alanyl-D-alanine-endopeptidase (penicillin-binding protein 4) [Chitinophaga sp. CF118]|uniref:D-alanyl-D-alanine carboxypeptidase/D-alanyl-D-alanine-endopeptidase n=1 Tax=Chitinophaga sp. CF118 TaxID=1884367 RepID=UPI0008DF064A|nr:D-alanyl-D-alanine carboxypeptidase [Chitinophaga sp. CF118]SFE69381.1 D-alanyl-D-alanine carboxypeptidase / D-alanyl-D-alanine-endopeptidase (penicillin-binding protein 4) [Chitinophaga sp. CF118]
MKRFVLLCSVLLCLQPGALAQFKDIQKWAETELLNSVALRQAHTGICIYEPATGKYWYRYQDDRYFTPASNTKIFSLYTGLRFLGDSLPALRYLNTDSVLYVKGTGDPSFLHPDYTLQPAFQLLQQTGKRIEVVPVVNENKRFGSGWAWSDYADYYQPELSEWPVYGNVAHIRHHGDTNQITPKMFNDAAHFSYQQNDTLKELLGVREELSNRFNVSFNSRNKNLQETEVPFITGNTQDLAIRLQDTLHRSVTVAPDKKITGFTMLNSIPVDSLFTPMMNRSDNFFAEQTLMMCASRLWDTISTSRMIEFMEQTYLSKLPDTPRWVDGSGLSRYNLFTPRDFVSVLTDMYKTYDTARLYSIFPTGGKGTLKNYYKQQFVHAKTGTLSGCVALSGYLITRKKKTLVFSVLVNNHNNSASNVRRTVESFLTQIWEQY